MSTKNQQIQTKYFFNKFSRQWSINAKINSDSVVNVVKFRNTYVENIAKKFCKQKSKTLDVGCGTGDLVICLLKKNFDSIGIDFAPNMIKESIKIAQKHKFDESRFIKTSFFDFHPIERFDLISANGFIEYISEIETDKFLKKSYDLLNKKGILVFESRNRLFNTVSFNEYTIKEIKLGEIKHIIDECILFNKCKNIRDLLQQKFITKIKKNFFNHTKTRNKILEINVSTRMQYTPFQLVHKLQKNKFQVLDFYPCHIHGITTGAKEIDSKIHTSTSNYLQNMKKIHLQLMPFTSSYMIAARKF